MVASSIPSRPRSKLGNVTREAKNSNEAASSFSTTSLQENDNGSKTLGDLDQCAHPCRHHPISQKYPGGLDLPHAKNLNKFIRDFSKSLPGVFPRPVDYGKVHTLFISWKADDLGTQLEIERLATALEGVHFSSRQDKCTMEHFEIPSKRSSLFLEEVIVKARNSYALDREDLLIIYYGGHGKNDEYGGSIWHANTRSDSPDLNWSKVEERLMDCEGKILFILDCCASAAMQDPRRWRGVKEMLAAAGNTGKTTGVAENSFTKGLIKCLKDLDLNGKSLNISSIHSRIVSRMMQYGLKLTPYRVGISERANENSILLRFQLNDIDATTELATTETKTADSDMEAIHANLQSACRVLISIRLENPAQPLVADDWLVWMKNYTPPGILSVEPFWDYLRPEGVFQSRSTLLLVSMPIDFWNILPHDPAYSFIDLIESENLMNIRPSQYSLEKLDASSPTDIYVGTTVTAEGGYQAESQQVSDKGTENLGIMGMPFYKHRPLPEEKDHIRLLKVLPGGGVSNMPSCELIEAVIVTTAQGVQVCVPGTTKTIAYEALSGVWGRSSWQHRIRVIADNKHSAYFSHMIAPETLVLALKHLLH